LRRTILDSRPQDSSGPERGSHQRPRAPCCPSWWGKMVAAQPHRRMGVVPHLHIRDQRNRGL